MDGPFYQGEVWQGGISRLSPWYTVTDTKEIKPKPYISLPHATHSQKEPGLDTKIFPTHQSFLCD